MGLNLTPLNPRPTPPPADGQGELFPAEKVEYELHLLTQMQDDLTRSRLREALWISIVVHLVALILIYTAPHWMPRGRAVQLISAEDMLKSKELTYLEMPADKRPTVQPRDSNVISDKDRSAMSRRPTIDNAALEELRRRMAQQQQQAQQQAAQQGAPQPAPNRSEQPPQQAQNTNPNALTMQQPPQPKQNPFAVQGTAGSAIQQAMRNANRGLDSGGVPGFGAGVSGSKVYGNAEVLSDTMGVDFEPYLKRVVDNVRVNWYSLIPESAMPPFLKKGKLMIEFVILPDGKVAGMQVVPGNSSGDIALDRAAWGGISKSDPFQPLPKEFKGPYLRLRFRFYYNPDRGELQ